MAEQNQTNAGLVILSVLLPIVGYIYYFSNRDDEPDVTKNYLWAAIGGSIIGLLLVLG